MLQFLVFGLVATASASAVHEGSCPELKPVENFNLTAYQGLWYGISKIPNEFEKGGKCATAEYTLNGDEVKVKNTHVVDGVQSYVEGSAKLAPDANNSGKLLVTLNFGAISREQSLSVVLTDYSNYAVVYNCKSDDKNKTHSDSVWVMSRSKKLEGDAKTTVDKFLKDHANALDPTKLVETDFSDEACKFTTSAAVTIPQTKQ